GKDPRVSRSRTAFALGLVVPLLVVGGCSNDEPQPRIAPSESPSPTDSSSAPAPMGPVQTVRAWVEARNVALSTGDTSAVRELSHADCKPCEGLIEPIERIYAAGGHFETKGWSVVKAKLRKAHGATAVVDTGITISGGATVSEAGADPVDYQAENHVVVFRLRPVGDGWQLSFLGFLS
ncbi:MAG TPA: DUF6318 family protein, partial [Nocardioides sp.]|nr:DUF6318 family protein [Nocardioides sp.]